MNTRLKIKSLILLCCLFFSADAVINYKLLVLKNHDIKSGYQVKSEVSLLSLFSARNNELTSEKILHAATENNFTNINVRKIPSSFVSVGSESSSKHQQPEKVKKRRIRCIQNTCLLIEPLSIQNHVIVIHASKEYIAFFQQWIDSHEFNLNALRGPPPVVA